MNFSGVRSGSGHTQKRGDGMAKETIDAIRRAEQETKAAEAEAARKAQSILDQAGKDADNLIRKAEEETLREAEQALAAAEQKQKEILEQKRKETEAEVQLLRNGAKAKIPEAVEAVLKSLTD